MTNPFDDLESDGDTDGQEETDTEPEPEPVPEPTTQPTRSIPEQATNPEPKPESGPAFEYNEVQQKPFYARAETVANFENSIRTTIIPQLAEAGVLDEEMREIHDAVLRLANEQPERVAELVLEERRR
ncbi:hypothetical protein [Natrialba sp. SSL1]|uniref:hypothetical protein n=1 Tax=Natrialba sp. SSL1 TaxID=1869245 RepID=UPI0008F8B87E|nr:hypothetical protein [Natrialba sp. SSL1]OIB55786.1 hypothetical protein BBD46_02960 [Natrialba sp. SSL1]